MNKINHLGNIKETYEEPRIVQGNSLVTSPNLVLKLYNMVKKNSSLKNDLPSAKKFIEDKIMQQEIKPEIGFGFAILSFDMLNIAQWSKEYPIVIKNQIYTYNPEKGLKKSSNKEDVNGAGSFCIYELSIVNHERDAWKKYLQSDGTREDKLTYLTNVLTGEL